MINNKTASGRYGTYVYNAADLYVGKSIEYYGEWAQHELDLLRTFIKPGDTVIDIGANIGTHTLAFAQFVEDSGQVIAFEPQRLIYQCLCANLAVNSIDNVLALNLGVGRQPGVLRLPPIDYAAPKNFGGIALEENAMGEAVNVVSLEHYDPGQCALIKLDVEGMEAQVLEGARPLLSKYEPVMYIENNVPEQSSALVTLLRELDYQLFWHLSPYFNPENFNQRTDDIFERTFDRNMLCFRTLPAQLPAGLVAIES